MSNVVVTRRNVFQRLGDAIKGIVIGIILFLVAFPVLFINEGRAIKTHRALVEGAGAVIEIESSPVDPNYEGDLVHMVDTPVVTETLSDPQFGINIEGATGLRRSVEMYQWHEDKKTETRTSVGGTEERVTTYSYRTDWSSRVISSGSFHDPAGHSNPGQMPVEDASSRPNAATFGAFNLSSRAINMLGGWQTYPLPEDAALPNGFRHHGGGVYMGADPGNPQVGDVRITFEYAMPQVTTIVAQQNGSGFTDYETSNGRKLFFVSDGSKTAQEVFDETIASNKMLTWIIRLIGFLMMFFGLNMLFKPLEVIASIIPFAGRIVAAGGSIIAFLIAAPTAIFVIAIGWVFYRPLLGIPLLIVAGGLGYLAFKKLSEAKVPEPAPEEPAPAA